MLAGNLWQQLMFLIAITELIDQKANLKVIFWCLLSYWLFLRHFHWILLTVCDPLKGAKSSFQNDYDRKVQWHTFAIYFSDDS